jgi:tetratricopeptide (TPR) repeat protein
VSASLLVEYYQDLPERQAEDSDAWLVRFHTAISTFRKKVAQRYNEGTLQRLLDSDVETRRAAVLALGLIGSMASNKLLAGCLHDDDERVCELATGALWALWFRADREDNNAELQRLVRLKDRGKILAGLDALIERAPQFAEAFNQRAIVLYQIKAYERSIADCEKVLALNPYHFGAQAGLGQCLLQLGRQRAALKAFRLALRINPTMPGIAETVRALEEAIDDGSGRDEKK